VPNRHLLPRPKPITALADLVGDKTIEDVENSPREITPGMDPLENGVWMKVPDSLNNEYRKTQEGSIWYLGPSNRGDPNNLANNELNNSLVTYKIDGGSARGIFGSFGAVEGFRDTDGGLYVEKMAMVFKDIVLIPDSKDVYLHGTDPYNDNADIYVRVVRHNSKYKDTYLKCFNVNSKDIFDPYSTKKSKDAGDLTDEEWATFLVPGDTIGMLTQFHNAPGYKYKVYYDENEKPILRMFANIRSMGADKMEAVLHIGQ
jgi:hypothetical protein